MANVKKNLENHSFRMNLLRKKAIVVHKKATRRYHGSIGNLLGGEGDYLP